MKKITTLFIILFICLYGLFANPTIPKTNSNWPVTKKLGNKNILTYFNNSCQNLFSIRAVIDKTTYKLEFDNYSYVTKSDIMIIIYFLNEERLDEYIASINTLNLEEEFINLRKQVMAADIEPMLYLDDENSPPKTVMYQVYTYSVNNSQ